VETFRNRIDAGRHLARQLDFLRNTDLVVLGLPRGGVPVAAEVAKHLGAPLDVIVVRKLGVPIQPELAMGAIGEEGIRVLDQRILDLTRVSVDDLRDVEFRERAILQDRVRLFRNGRKRVPLQGKTALIVDDGIATGSTARAACAVARRFGAHRVVVASPVCSEDSSHGIPEADQVLCSTVPPDFNAVGAHYLDFTPTSDDEVIAILNAAARRDEEVGLAASRSQH
jgi:putative phosphoribosyl transferase